MGGGGLGHVTADPRRDVLKNNYEVFAGLRAEALHNFNRGRFEAASARAQVAATYAYFHHCGIWASPELERMLVSIGRTVLDGPPPARDVEPAVPGAPIKRVLHVLTRVASIGGHSRMLWRWINQDDTRSHSVVLTRQGALPIPDDLHDATASRGGTVLALNRTRGTTLSWAQDLRNMAADFDLVVLHIFAEDAIPVIAFADREGMPPVAFVDQADHAFSFGYEHADVYVGLRKSGAALAVERRGVAPERVTATLPITLPLMERTQSRADAKREVGWPEDSVVMLSIARAPKFRDFNGQHFSSMFRGLLERHPNLMLVVIGPDPDEVWRELGEQTNDRARALGERTDTKAFYEAADIYLDSFPVISNTSLLEAGSHSIPLVSRCRQPGEHSVFCADAPGFSDHIFRSSNVDEYIEAIDRLVVDPELRNRTGDATRQAIVDAHVGSGWQQALELVYDKVQSTPRFTEMSAASDSPRSDELDLIWSELLGSDVLVDDVRSWHMKGLPVDLRVREWVGLSRRQRKIRPQLLFPEWVTAPLREFGERLRR